MIGLADILTTLQNGVTALNGVRTQLASAGFLTTKVSTTAPSSVGSITFSSSQPKGFLTVITSSGYSYLMPLY